jgi:hypothetical protein
MCLEALALRDRRAHALALIVVVATAVIYLGPMMAKGWVPFDEGTLGQSADRILLGQLPHRDFDEVYTGGLSFLHAAAFRVFGENLVSLRFVLFGTILIALPVCYYIASRFTSAAIAALVTIAILFGSFPSYPASMPSWYNLIFALFATAAFLRYLEVRSSRWIVVAGVCAGTSVLFKIVGVYLIAGGVVFLIFDAHVSASAPLAISKRRAGATALMLLVIAAISAAPFVIMRGRLQLAELVELVAPIVAIGACVAVPIRRRLSEGNAGRHLALFTATTLPFILGVALPLLCFAVPYATSGALASLFRGVFVLPQKRLAWATADSPPAMGVLLGVPALFLMTSRRFSPGVLRRYEAIAIVVVETGLVTWSIVSLNVTAALWLMVRMTAPLVAVAAAALAALSDGDDGTSALQRKQLVLLASMAAWCALIQYPVASFQYFLYVLPLFVLLAVGVAAIRGTLDRSLALSSLAAFLALSVLLRQQYVGRADGSSVTLTGHETATLDLPRGGLTIRRDERDVYVALVRTIQQHAKSRSIYVSPDAPEVYFLAERENPTRTLFDFFDEPNDRTRRVLAAVRDRDVDVVVINTKPRFSGPMPRDLADSLKARFREAAEIGRFEVRWR